MVWKVPKICFTLFMKNTAGGIDHEHQFSRQTDPIEWMGCSVRLRIFRISKLICREFWLRQFSACKGTGTSAGTSLTLQKELKRELFYHKTMFHQRSCHDLKSFRITVKKQNPGKTICQPLGWHIVFGWTCYLPYTLIQALSNNPSF